MIARKSMTVTIFVLLVTLSLFYSGCVRTRGELFPVLETPIVWPQPPETSRIQYVGSLSTEEDLRKELSWSEGLAELITGKKNIGVMLSPYALAVNEEIVYVTDVSGAVVHIINLDSRYYSQFKNISPTEDLRKPVGLTIVDEDVFVADAVRHEICVFDKKGRFQFSFGRDRLQRPSGIAYWPAGQKVYVADTVRHVVDVFSPEGKFMETIGSRGSQPGQFNFPTQLCVDKNGKLYVSDTLNYRIQIFSAEGKYLTEFGQQGDRPGNFAHPCGVAVDSFGNSYVIDRQFENVQIFNNQGQILMAWGQEGSDPGEFWLPAGIIIDNRNRIYVADSFNKRIQIFDLLEESR
jgi:DNA-binding beta-propeller fold protein YncE